MEGFPEALVIASLDSINVNNNVLYRLVRPLPDGSGVESTERMVNVVPYRRIYCFSRKEEIDEFRDQILSRPLVLHPVLHFGRGCGHYCGMCYQDEPWIIMVNQTHPKILGRLQMGLDSAKLAIARGQSCEIRFRFGKLIQRVYREHLTQKERGEAQDSGSSIAECLTYFRFAEWEHGDLIIRSHGIVSRMKSSTAAIYDLGNLESDWEFQDIGMHEMSWNQLNGQTFPKPHLSRVTEDEIREVLPGWTINGVSPLEEIGESVPQHNYSYAQAGRLYESFRKKRRQRRMQQNAASDAPPAYGVIEGQFSDDAGHDIEAEGAVGYDPGDFPHAEPDPVAVENNFSQHSGQSQSRYHYRDEAYDYDDDYYGHRNRSHSDYEDQQMYHTGSHHMNRHCDDAPVRSPSYPNAGQQQLSVVTSQPDKYGHIHASVEIKSPPRAPPRKRTIPNGADKSHNYQYQDHDDCDSLEPPGSDYHHYAGVLQKQDSDRSSRSTNADSGYCPEPDGERSRGGSYDNSDPSNTYGFTGKGEGKGHEVYPLRDTREVHGGLENPAFNYHDHEVGKAMEKHKALVASMLQQQNGESSYSPARSPHDLSPKNTMPYVMKAPPRQKRLQHGSTSSNPVAESYI